MDENVFSDDGDSSYTYQEMIGDDDFNLNKFEEKDFCDYLLKKIKESRRIKQRDYDIFVTYLNVGNQSAVARMFGVTQFQITKTIINVRKEVISNGWLYA